MAQTLQNAIQRVLPSVNDDTLSNILNKQQDTGVEDVEDLQFVNESDLTDVLKPIQIRKLLTAWSNENNATPDPGSPQLSAPGSPIVSQSAARMMSALSSACPDSPRSNSLCPDSPVTSSPGRISLTRTAIQSSPSRISSWTSDFSVPWDSLPSTLKQVLRSGNRPGPADRRTLVRKIVDAMRVFQVNPTRSQCLVIVQKVVGMYSSSLMDVTLEGNKLGTGYASLLNQVKCRVEHLNRNNTLARLRKPRSASTGVEPKQRNGTPDSYGCISWQPLDLPDGETEDTLEAKRTEILSVVARTGPTMVTSQTTSMMALTYYAQRKHINQTPPIDIDELGQMWPLLMTPHGLFQHFEMLTGIDAVEGLTQAFNKRGKDILSYFRSRGSANKKEIRDIIHNIDENMSLEAVVTQILMSHLKENEDSLFFIRDVTTSSRDLTLEDLPSSPRLILLGNSMCTASKWMVSIEGKVAIQGNTSSSAFTSGLAALFASYYVFNLQYQEGAVIALEFFQRCFFGINPSEGSKCSMKKTTKNGKQIPRKKSQVSQIVATLVSNIAAHSWEGHL